MSKNKLVKLNDYLFESITKLNDEKHMQEKGAEEIAKCTAMAKATQTYINVLKQNMTMLEKVDGDKDKFNELHELMGTSNE